MSEPVATSIDLDGHSLRVWSKGSGPKIGFFAGWGGLPRWIPFLDALAESRTVIVPSLPGFPGGGRAQLDLDSHLDWVVAARRIFVAAGLEGADLVGSSVGGGLAAEIAALWPDSVRGLALISPLGLYRDDEPPADVFARRADEYAGLLCVDPDAYRALKAAPDDVEAVEWEIEQARASEAAARMLWPIGNTRLDRRLPMISRKTLIVQGDGDRVVPRSYSGYIAGAIAGEARIEIIAAAGHLAELDKPRDVAKAILDFMN